MQPPRVYDVLNMRNSLNLNKSVGHNNLSPYFLRVASTILAPALCYFIDNAFRLSMFHFLNQVILKVLPTIGQSPS